VCGAQRHVRNRPRPAWSGYNLKDVRTLRARPGADPLTGEGSLFDVPPAAFGRFRVLHQIGAGSLGPVFRGEDPLTGEPVAIKSLRVDLPPERSQQVADELAALAARLPADPSLIAPLGAGLADLVPYVVWPLLAGTSLDVALREYGPAACHDALPRLAALAAALDRAAAHGVWHGALHPRDIMVADEETWVVGLGITPILERAGVRLPARRPYTAPEQLEGHATSPQSDQFALAAIAHEWLFGRRVAGPANESLSVPLLPGVDRARMTDAFSAGLAVRPADRFASAAEFVRALDASVVDEHEATNERMARTGRREAFAAPAAPMLPLGDAGIDQFAPGPDDEPVRFQDFGGEDDPLDQLGAPAPPPMGLTLDEDEGLQLAAADLEDGDALASFAVSEDASPTPRIEVAAGDEYPVDASDREPPARGGDEMMLVEDDDEAPEFDEQAAAVRPAPIMLTRGLLRQDRQERPPEEPMSSLAMDEPVFRDGDHAGPVRHDSRGGYGAGTVVVALLMGLLLGTAAGYGLALRQPATSATIGTESTGPVAAAPVENAPGSPASTPAASPPAAPSPMVEDAPIVSAPLSGPGTAPPPAPEERPGRLLVRSTPAGAQVRVDGELRGVTPLTLRDLPLASHDIVISAEGYQPSSHRVALTAARPSRSLDVPLARPAPAAAPAVRGAPAPRPAATASGSLVIESRPSGAEVRLDDRPVGKTPVTVPSLAPGNYRVTIGGDGYQTWSTTVRVVAGERARVAASLVGGRLEE
jgi:hypothetical protein